MTRCLSQTSAFSITPTTVFFAGLIFLFTILFHTNTVHAQGLPPAAPSSGPPKPYEPPSLLSGGAFTSIEGRFTISLPQQGHGFSQLTIPTPFGIARGDSYQWRMKEAGFVVGHADAPVPVDSPEQTQKVFESLHEQIKRLANANNGAMREDKQIQLGKYPGIEQRVDLFSAFIVQRTYVVSRRLYQAVMVIKTEQREFESAATKVLDSFKVLEDSDVSAKLAEEAKKAEPTPLPQQPVAQRAGTDAADNGMHGQVKTVLEESQDLSGTWSVQTKKRDSFVQYNQQGNRVRQESYDYKGNLDEITVYGYIDRGNLPDIMANFDFSDPDMPNSKRTSTIVPQQALFLMNSPMSIDVARRINARSDVADAPDNLSRIFAIYRVIFQRTPKPAEIQLALSFVGTEAKNQPEADEFQTEGSQQKTERRRAALRMKQQQNRQAAIRPIQNEGERVERKPLTPWETYTQALLLSNEAAYVN